MGADYREFTGRLTRLFAVVNVNLDEQILAQQIAGGDTYSACHLEIEEWTVRRLVGILSRDARLWVDFQRAVEAHRRLTHWTSLVEHVFTVGNLEGKLTLLEQARSCPDREDRRLLAGRLNCIDGEIAFCRSLADRRDLAARLDRAADSPLVDGLTLRGLTYLFGEHLTLWHAFQELVTASVNPEEAPHSARHPEL